MSDELVPVVVQGATQGIDAPEGTCATRQVLGQTLLVLARNAIAGELGEAQMKEVESAELNQPGACFVTLTKDGKLRGCIGSLEARRPLREDVRANACACAFRDPRFPPVTRDEFPHLRLEISLLTQPQPMTFSGEEDALGQLHPNVDGVVLETGNHRSTFLPQVWEQIPEPRQFLVQLKIKAGLPPDFWSAELRLSRYQVEKWKETERVPSPQPSVQGGLCTASPLRRRGAVLREFPPTPRGRG